MPDEIALWIKIAYTAFLCVLIPVYWRRYGPANFLWFSDIALFGTALALWREDSLLASMMAVGVLLPELTWNIGLFARLLFGVRITSLADYMFDPKLPIYLRALSLFHVLLPLLLLWLVHRLGYDPRAFAGQTSLAWLVLPVTWLVTEPAKNINWVFGPSPSGRSRRTTFPWLLAAMLLFPLGVFLPTHLMLDAWFG